MKKMICLLMVYFMVTVFRIKSFMIKFELEVKEIICVLKEKVIFIVKQACVIVLKIYQSKVIPEYGKIVSGICGIVMFITKSSYVFKLCRIVMKINMALNIMDKLCYIGILICV